MKKISLMIPCYNEEEGLKRLLNNLPYEKLNRLGYQLEILVVDNNSKDKTAEVARSFGVRVIFEPKPGKGNAIRAGFRNISVDTDFVVMLDGDDTYKPHEIDWLSPRRKNHRKINVWFTPSRKLVLHLYHKKILRSERNRHLHRLLRMEKKRGR